MIVSQRFAAVRCGMLPGGILASLLVFYTNTPQGRTLRELLDQELGGMVGGVINYVADDNHYNWSDVDGASWPTLYQQVTGGPYHATVFVSMNETRQELSFFPFLAVLRDMLLTDLLNWAQRHSDRFGGQLHLALEWSLRPCAGAVLDLSAGQTTGHFQPEIE